MTLVIASSFAVFAYVAATVGLWLRMRRVAGGQSMNKTPIVAVGLIGLEIIIACLQAYVFAILTCMYLNDAMHPAH